MTRRNLLQCLAAGLLPAACSTTPPADELNLFNWSDYIGKRTIPGFKEATGITVHESYYAEEEEMFAKLKTGVQGYDLAVATDFILPRFKALGLSAPYPPGARKGMDNLFDRFKDPPYDPGLAASVPYLWGTTGIAYNRKQVKERPTSWKALWDERYKGRISMLDNPREAVGVAMVVQGLDADSSDDADLEKAKDILIRQKPLLKHYSSATYMDELAAGEVWLAMGWSGDVLQASLANPDIDYVIPDEGGFYWVDSLVLLAASERKDAAVRFVNYILRPEVAAEISLTVRYPTANEAARGRLPRELREDRRIYPDRETEKRLRFQSVKPEKELRKINETWQKVKLA